METSSTSNPAVHPVPPSGVLPLELDDPSTIGGHRLVGRLGSGGMGVVYLGRDDTGALVAVKTARAEDARDEDVRDRFRTEAACAGRVPPSCTARVLADGTAETPPYIVTEYIEGPSLAQVTGENGPLPAERLHALAVGVARALAAIHAAGLVHRDLKPANVLLTPFGPRVIDFGIAQRVPAAGGPTAAGVVMGSPGWIPPERLTGNPATSASDVFGWGCLVAYAATGRHPFGQGDGDAMAQRMIHEPPELDGVAEPLRGLVGAALAKDPATRPSVSALLAALTGEVAPDTVPPGTARSGPARAATDRPGVAAPGAAHPARRSPVVAVATAAAVVAATAAAVVTAIILGGDGTAPWQSPVGGHTVPSSNPPAHGTRRPSPPGVRPALPGTGRSSTVPADARKGTESGVPVSRTRTPATSPSGTSPATTPTPGGPPGLAKKTAKPGKGNGGSNGKGHGN